ncbi:FRG domain-containing protein [Priestia aryabhattai B8W22]|uniref:FRG domain-containing protein n=1 Tax=Priestia aryabhattai TaxID=412384 RepID=UPI0008926189|nr:FRG domain-containing protein [Priestia aryabhattai B8W22]
MNIINNVSEYIELVSKLTENSDSYVYRGENKIYATSCVPNIFREHRRLSNFSFEKNILNKVRSEGLDGGSQSYLLTAIEAQHGGFPSRLLDISYNSLIALHFAVTPFYNRHEHVDDDSDGQVVIIKIEDMLSPSSDELENLYRNELLNNKSTKNIVMLLAHQHKMVDFYSKNQRIKAQQGGFIIFYGNEFRPLPDYMLQRIIIPSAAKATIRNELDRLFGISNAYVYPESNNLVSRIVRSTDRYANFDTFDNVDEIEKVLRKFERNLKHYTRQVLNERKQKPMHEKELNRIMENKRNDLLEEYCGRHGIEYIHIPRNRQTKELTILKKHTTSHMKTFLKVIDQMLVDHVTKIECYIRDFYLDLIQSKELMMQKKDEQLSEEYFKGLEERFELIVTKNRTDLKVILRDTLITLTPYEKIIE